MPSQKASVIAGLLVAAAVIAVYAPTVMHPFTIYDDPLNVTENPSLKPSVSHLLRFWVAPYEGLYAPLPYTLYMALYAVGGLDPRIFHAANVVLHAAAAVLVMICLVRLGFAIAPAAAGALVFGLHPLQVESVAWVTEARGLLAGAFSFAALACYVRIPLRGRDVTAATVLFALALLSKPTAASVPLMALVLDVAWLDRPWRRSLVRLAPWFAMVVLLAAITSRAQVGDASIAATPPAWRPLVALDAAAHALRKLVAPVHLGLDYGRTPVWLLADRRRWLPASACLAAVVVLALLPKNRLGLAILGLFIAGMAPTLGFIPFGHQVHSTVADRFTYLALFAVAILAATVFALRIPAARALVVVAILALAGLSIRQQSFWRTDVTLFQRTIAVNPQSHLGLNNLGIALVDAGRPAEAIEPLQRAVALYPGAADVRNTLGRARMYSGDAAGAVLEFEDAVARDPTNLRIWNNLGEALLLERRWLAAADAFEHVTKVAPHYVNVQINIARAYRVAGRLDEALYHARQALRLEPDNIDARKELDAVQREIELQRGLKQSP